MPKIIVPNTIPNTQQKNRINHFGQCFRNDPAIDQEEKSGRHRPAFGLIRPED